MIDINEAKLNVDGVYKNLSEIVDDIVNKQTINLDSTIKKLSAIDSMSNEDLRNCMMLISIEAYTLSTFKEQSSLKDACATALYKEGVADSFNTLSGTVEARKNQSVQDNMDKQIVNILYTSVSDRFKSKVDEAHRIANVISNVLISRASDAKLYYNPRSEAFETEEEEVF